MAHLYSIKSNNTYISHLLKNMMFGTKLEFRHFCNTNKQLSIVKDNFPFAIHFVISSGWTNSYKFNSVHIAI
jgi:hypothetical protein